MKPVQKICLFCILSVAFICCDRLTKNLAKTYLMNQPGRYYFHNTIILGYVENTGAALSMGDNMPKAWSFWLLGIIPLIIIWGLFAYVVKNAKQLSLLKIVSFALIFSGGMGNVIDRIIFDRHVTDFMNIGILSLRTGIFNFADVCVTAGAICLIIAFREKPKSGASSAPGITEQ